MKPFKAATWNVNSLRVRLPHVLAWLQTEQPDILALQETKLTDDDFPLSEIHDVGYQAVYSGQKTYNGVALLSRARPGEVQNNIPGLEDEQRRFLAADYDGLRVINLYVPNGASVGSDKYQYKLAWLEKVSTYLQAQLAAHERLLVLGDFNIAPQDLDVHDPKLWEGQVLVSEPERAAFRALLNMGLVDTLRLFEPGGGVYTWWDYRAGAFRRNHGLRIDHILLSPALRALCASCRVDKAPRKLERPSDHAPVVAEFSL
ncbi:MAG: exodeoxyribonuclease III [Gammaproteobacteria bacterium]|nr:MAG: exodeoxyribonuclease III [Gammaproteobacteria bacterium]